MRLGIGVCVLAAALGCRATTPADAEAKDDQPEPARERITLAGQVRSPERPLAGARVCAEEVCTDTDADGHFELAIDPGVHFVVAAADRHMPRGQQAVIHEHEPEVTLSFELLPGGRLHGGTVVDIDERPIVGATVSHAYDPDEARAVVTTQTDEHGRFVLWSGRLGELGASAPGHMPMVIATPDRRRLVLLPGSSIHGIVVDGEGRPIADARVSTEDEESAVETDAQGRFVLTRLGPGEHTLVAVAELPTAPITAGSNPEPGSSAWAGELDLTLGFGERREQVVVTLDRPYLWHRALIVDVDTGEPVPGCLLGMRSPSTWMRTGWTDEDGRFDLALDVEHRLTGIECPGYVAFEPFRRIGFNRPEPTRIEVRRGTTLTGTIIDESEQPVAGVSIVLEPEYISDRGLYWDEQPISDSQGEFTITGLPANRFSIDFDEHQTVSTFGGERRLSHSFTIPSAGRVELEVGADAIGRWLWLVQCRDEVLERSEAARVDSDRLAVFERMSPGTWLVGIERVNWTPVVCSSPQTPPLSVTVSARATTRLRLDPGPERDHAYHEVQVRVIDQAGAPVAGAVVAHDYVAANDDARESLGPREWRTNSELALTDADGRAVVELGPLEVFVIAARPGLFGVTRLCPREHEQASIRLAPVPAP